MPAFSEPAARAVAHAEIRDLLDRYHGAINFRDWSVLADVFTEDAVWEAMPPLDLRFAGRAAVLAGLKDSVGKQELLVQSSSGLLIDLHAPSEATVRSMLVEFGRSQDTRAGWRAFAEYHDHVVLDGGTWRFQRRSLYLRYQGESPAPGDVLAGRSSGA